MSKSSRIWITAGLLLLSFALLLTGYNLLSAKNAEKASSDISAQLAEIIPAPQDTEVPDYVINPDMEMPTISIDGAEYIGKLLIPGLDLELPVQSEWSYPSLRISPCRYLGSAYLDSLIICAHNYDCHFGRLKQLHQGDEVIFEDAAGNLFTYSVTELEILNPTAIEAMESSDSDLTLFTCTIGGRTRVTLRCDRCG